MAALRGVMNYGHHAMSVSRLGHRCMSCRLSTWQTHVEVRLDKYGRASAEITRGNMKPKILVFDKPEISMEDLRKDEAKYMKKR